MLAEFRRRLRGERGEGFGKTVKRRDGFSEGSRTADAVGVCIVVLVLVRRNTAKFLRRPEKHHAADGADHVVRRIAQVFRREYLLGAEFHDEAASNAPHFVGWKPSKYLRRIVGKHKHALWTLLCDVVGYFGESLRRRKSDAAG